VLTWRFTLENTEHTKHSNEISNEIHILLTHYIFVSMVSRKSYLCTCKCFEVLYLNAFFSPTKVVDFYVILLRIFP
jgi:hypothetical protein